MDFNSIKVRLKQFGKHTKRQHLQFQFHKGTIKTLHPRHMVVNVQDFNSIKVRLKPIVWGYVISLFSIGFVNAKLINLIEKNVDG